MKNGFTLIELLIVVAIVSIILVIVIPTCKFFTINKEYSSGERMGTITKISQKGLFFKTWEGEMNLGGMATNCDGQPVPNIWKFSVTDPAVLAQLQDKCAKGERATLTYVQLWVVSFREGETNYLIKGVK